MRSLPLAVAVFCSIILLSQSVRRVIVVGGGAAGYFSAIQCATVLHEKCINAEVIILEAGQEVLSKVLISGGGRCNVMHDPSKGIPFIAKSYPRGNRELLGPFNAKFGPWETLSWFAERGLELKVESDGRMFPTTDKSTSVIDTLQASAKKARVKVFKRVKVTDVVRNHADEENGSFRICCTVSQCQLPDNLKSDEALLKQLSKGEINCDRVILAPGSSRIALGIVHRMGHKKIIPLPSLFSFKVHDSALTALSGISVKFGRVRLVVPPELKLRGIVGGASEADLRATLTQRGPILITQQGFSGPAILRLSSFAAKVLAAMNYEATIEISWFGELSVETVLDLLLRDKKRFPLRRVGKSCPSLDSRLLGDLTMDDPAYTNAYNMDTFNEFHSTKFADSQDGMDSSAEEVEEDGLATANMTPMVTVVRRRLWQYLLRTIDKGLPDSRWCDVDLSALKLISQSLCSSRYRITGRGLYRDEFVTCGGVDLKEVRIDRMESKVQPGLYFAGEVLDIDGVTGGFNFQSAWTTGFVAGDSCANSLQT